MSNSFLGPPVSFGLGLQAPDQNALRAKLIALASSGLNVPLHVDTLLGLSPSRAPGGHPTRKLLLFDLHRLFVLDEVASLSSRLDSLRRFLLDDYPVQPVTLVRAHLEQDPFRFLYPLEVLDLLPYLWGEIPRHHVMILGLSTGSIHLAELLAHPESEEGIHSSPPAIRLKSLRCSSDFRSGITCRFDGLTSPEVGPLRGERLISSLVSLPNVLTRVAWLDGREEAFCGGLGSELETALHVARCEGIERFQAALASFGDTFVFASYQEVAASAIDPESLFFRLPRLPATGPYLPYGQSMRMYWTWADEPESDSRWLVPAQEVWLDTRPFPGEQVCIRNTTNGCALGATVEEAALFALGELIERDAYLTMWYLRRRCRKVIPESVTADLFQLLLLRLRRACPNYSLHIFDIRTEIAFPAVAIVATREFGRGPLTLHTAAARPRFNTAATAALKEICGRLGIVGRREVDARSSELLTNPAVVFTPDDHTALYGSDEAFHRLSFMGFEAPPTVDASTIDSQSLIAESEEYDLRDVLTRVTRHLGEHGIRTLFKDISHQALALRDIHCVKAIAPGLFPMWYGHYFVRFSLTDRLKCLADQVDGNVGVGENLCPNLDVHPFG